jgi:tetratricopeptide (TPR) repeat protein
VIRSTGGSGNPELDRARLFLGQGRMDRAEPLLRQALARDPDDGLIHSLLALCLLEGEKYTEATAAAETGLGLAPDEPHTAYIYATVLSARNLPRDAQPIAERTLAMDPQNPDYWALNARVQLQLGKTARALELIDEGLATDAAHIELANLKAVAERRLGRAGGAVETARATLARSPDSADTHVNMGWSLLQTGKPKEALVHFREALRLEPGNEWARQGLIEGLKARFFFYRWMLAYFMFMARLSGRMQWGIILGAWLGYQVIRAIGSSNPALQPITIPILLAYLLFCVTTWLSYPFFNLMLFLSRSGRLALSPSQRLWSLAFGATTLLPIGFGIVALATDSSIFIALALLSLGLIPPLATGATQRFPQRQTFMIVYSIGIFAFFGVLAYGVLTNSAAIAKLTTAYVVASIGSVFIANLMSTKSPPVLR